MVVVEVAREASKEATGELVTRSHFDTALAQLKSRLAGRLVTAGDRDRGRGRRGVAVYSRPSTPRPRARPFSSAP